LQNAHMGNSACCTNPSDVNAVEVTSQVPSDAGKVEAPAAAPSAVTTAPEPAPEPVMEEPAAPAPVEEKAPEPAQPEPEKVAEPEPAKTEEIPPVQGPKLEVVFQEFDGETKGALVTKAFVQRPLGINFASKTPVVVTKVNVGGHAEEIGVKEGWIIIKIGDRTLEGDDELKEFKALVAFFHKQAEGLPVKSAAQN